MSAESGLIYEVTLTIDPDVVERFDAWLAQHVEEMMLLPGFMEARVFSIEDDEQGRPRRVTHYTLDSEESLENYFATSAAAMRQSGVDLFGEKFSATRRILRDTRIAATELSQDDRCLNCETVLTGQYCGTCGQRARSRLISLWELIQDAFGDLFELDSRIWRTLLPLLCRPGILTWDYLQGRRARFMPPFRTYLVLSILFFVVLLFDPKSEFGILFEPQPAEELTSGDETESNAQRAEDILKELADEGVITLPPKSDPTVDDESEKIDSGSSGDAKKVKSPKSSGVTISTNGGEGNCSVDDEDLLEIPAWIAKRVTRERLLAVCQKIAADSGKTLLQKLKDNIAAALFFLLPLMAFVLKLAYPLSKRYYVEHLLFVVHFHAFLFLILSLMILSTRAASWLKMPEAIIQVSITAVSLYIPIYLYKAMRRVYMQGHLATAPKYLFLIVAYITGSSLIFAVTALLAAFSI